MLSGARMTDEARAAAESLLHPPCRCAIQHHLHVSKRLEDDGVPTIVSPSSGAERSEEIARMLSGDRMTDEARAAAESLLHPPCRCAIQHHLHVSKRLEDDGVPTIVSPSSGAERSEEIARMLSGARITDEARAAAESLLHPPCRCAIQHHLHVSKRLEDDGVPTIVSPSSGAERSEEIARMLSGARITDEARAAAESLLHPPCRCTIQHHLHVSKRLGNDGVPTIVSPLSGAERSEEIARMLSGDRITDEARAAAESLLHPPCRCAIQHHLHVSRRLEDDGVPTIVSPSSGAERSEEIARMLSGVRMTDEARAAAKSLLHPPCRCAIQHHLHVSKRLEDDGVPTIVSPSSGAERSEEIARMLSGARMTDEARASAARKLAASTMSLRDTASSSSCLQATRRRRRADDRVAFERRGTLRGDCTYALRSPNDRRSSRSSQKLAASTMSLRDTASSSCLQATRRRRRADDRVAFERRGTLRGDCTYALRSPNDRRSPRSSQKLAASTMSLRDTASSSCLQATRRRRRADDRVAFERRGTLRGDCTYALRSPNYRRSPRSSQKLAAPTMSLRDQVAQCRATSPDIPRWRLG